MGPTQLHAGGDLGPLDAFELDARLAPLTTTVRPIVVLDLSAATDLHPAVASVVIRHQRQARRQGGRLDLVPPAAGEASRTLEQIGLVRTVAAPACPLAAAGAAGAPVVAALPTAVA